MAVAEGKDHQKYTFVVRHDFSFMLLLKLRYSARGMGKVVFISGAGRE